MKTTVLVLLCFIIVSLSGCSHTDASAKAVSIAKKAIEVTDSYLDREISSDSASRTLSDLIDEMEYTSTTDPTDEHHSADYSIETDLVILHSSIVKDSIDKSAESYDSVIESRNELAESAGLPKK